MHNAYVFCGTLRQKGGSDVTNLRRSASIG